MSNNSLFQDEKFLLAFIAPLLSLFGVILGWIVTASSTWFKSSKEDNRAKKQILPTLLELHYLLSKLDIQKAVALATDIVFKKLPVEAQTEINRQYMETLYANNLTSVILPSIESKLLDLEEKFNNSIDALAKYEPIIAFKLNGTTKIMEVFTLMRSSFEQIHLQFQNEISPEEKEEMEKVINKSRPKMLKATIGNIEHMIMQIADSINKKMEMQVKQILIGNNEIAESEIMDFVNGIIPENSTEN